MATEKQRALLKKARDEWLSEVEAIKKECDIDLDNASKEYHRKVKEIMNHAD